MGAGGLQHVSQMEGELRLELDDGRNWWELQQSLREHRCHAEKSVHIPRVATRNRIPQYGLNKKDIYLCHLINMNMGHYNIGSYRNPKTAGVWVGFSVILWVSPWVLGHSCSSAGYHVLPCAKQGGFPGKSPFYSGETPSTDVHSTLPFRSRCPELVHTPNLQPMTCKREIPC